MTSSINFNPLSNKDIVICNMGYNGYKSLSCNLHSQFTNLYSLADVYLLMKADL